MTMKYILAFLLTLSTSCLAQVPMTGAGKSTTGGGGGGYSGPGNVAGAGSATFWHSCTRAYTAAYAAGGGNACDLRRTSDNATCTVKFATNGFADLTVGVPCAGATVTSFCNSATCVVTKLYDHTAGGNCGGTCDISTSNTAKQPTYTLSCVSSLPCITMSGPKTLRLAAGSITMAQPYTMSTLQKVTGSFTAAQYLFQMDGPGAGFTFNATNANDNTWYASNGMAQGATDNVWHAAVLQSDSSTSSTHYLDSNGAVTANVGTPAQGDILVGSGDISGASDATYFESGGWSSSLGATVSANIIANQHGINGCNC